MAKKESKDVATKAKAKPAVTPATDPFIALKQEMDRVFDRFAGSDWLANFPRFDIAPWAGRSGDVTPSIDISETDDALKISAELPGMSEKDIDLSVRDGVLTLKGEKTTKKTEKKEQTRISERRYGAFERALRLPDTVDEAKIDAKFEKGVLNIVVPKREEAKKPERKIAIKG